MASVNWQKQTKQKAGAMRVHLGKKERVEKKHSNLDIDKNKSHLNVYIGCEDYSEAYQAMLKRVAEIDKLYPPLRIKKDRVICESLVCPCPKSIYDIGRSDEFFEGIHKIYSAYFGLENVHGTCVHYDEMHSYTDKDGKEKMSLAHAHTLVSAYAQWSDKTGERKGINGKNFEKKSRYNELNNLIHDYCHNTFGIAFLTGAGAQKKSVELLKAEGKIKDKKRELEVLNRQAESLKYNIAVLDSQYSDNEERNNELIAEIAEKEKELEQVYTQTEQLEAYNLERAERIKSCQTTSERWKERTRNIFERSEKIMKGNDENDYTNVSTIKNNHRSQKSKQAVRD